MRYSLFSPVTKSSTYNIYQPHREKLIKKRKFEWADMGFVTLMLAAAPLWSIYICIVKAFKL